jgi:hypothetical protein
MTDTIPALEYSSDVIHAFAWVVGIAPDEER